jgi:hypothetical protein
MRLLGCEDAIIDKFPRKFSRLRAISRLPQGGPDASD